MTSQYNSAAFNKEPSFNKKKLSKKFVRAKIVYKLKLYLHLKKKMMKKIQFKP